MNNANKILLFLDVLLAPFKGANWQVFFSSVMLASVFWVLSALNKIYTARIHYPVQFEYNHDSLMAVRDLPKEIPVNVTGGGWELLKKTISTNVDPIEIRLQNPAQTVFLTGSNLLPDFSEQLDGLNVNYVATDTVFLQIDEIIERKLHIYVDSASINLRNNFEIESHIVVEPDSVLFRGPSSLVNKFTDDFRLILSETDLHRHYDEELSMDLFSSSLIRKTPDLIRVSFNIYEWVETEADLKVEKVNFPLDGSINLTNESVKAKFIVRKDLRNNLDNLNYIIIADLNNASPKDSVITLEIVLQTDVIVIHNMNYIRNLELDQKQVKLMYVPKSP